VNKINLNINVNPDEIKFILATLYNIKTEKFNSNLKNNTDLLSEAIKSEDPRQILEQLSGRQHMLVDYSKELDSLSSIVITMPVQPEKEKDATIEKVFYEAPVSSLK
jgi:hypothetical protein